MSILLIILGAVFTSVILSFVYNIKLDQIKMTNDEINSDTVSFSCSAPLF